MHQIPCLCFLCSPPFLFLRPNLFGLGFLQLGISCRKIGTVTTSTAINTCFPCRGSWEGFHSPCYLQNWEGCSQSLLPSPRCVIQQLGTQGVQDLGRDSSKHPSSIDQKVKDREDERAAKENKMSVLFQAVLKSKLALPASLKGWES